MHPAYSVIFFTTASGSGYGLLALLGATAGMGLLPPDRLFGLVALGLALALISVGLLSATFHLGRPERAWRAFSQWRSSWLSREGVAAMATYIPAGMFGLGWMVFGRPDGWTAAMGLVASAGAVVTVACTAMIYASLKPVAQWHSRFTLPGYLVFSAMTGATILSALLCSFGIISKAAVVLAFAATLMGWTLKIATWNHNDTSKPRANANTATGLSGGQVRSVEWPHTEENYLLKEMGYRLARKHALRLRLVTQALAFAVPAALLGLGFVSEGVVAAAILIAAAVIQFAGMLIERWLFFAEARHSVVLYYGG